MKMQKINLFGIILIEGFITISAEILTIRQLVPWVGNSVIVTSLIIGFFLLFLAYGYLRGGKRGDDYAEILQLNFVIAALILGIGLSYGFINIFFFYLNKIYALNYTLTLIAYLSIITAPLVYILGQTVPIAMNLYKANLLESNAAKLKLMPNNSQGSMAAGELEHKIGAVGGTVLHLSTFGSFLGAVLTTLLLMQMIGVAKTVFVNYCLLLALMLLLMWGKKTNWWLVGVAVVSMPFVHIFNLTVEKNNFLRTNAYANYKVHPNFTLQVNASEVVNNNANEQQNNIVAKTGNLLEINKYAGSFVEYKTGDGFPCIEQMKKILFDDLHLRNANILVLGAGGFSISATNAFENDITYVDIDQDLEKIVKRNFLPNIRGKFVVADARQFLQANEQKYKAIVSDAYSAPNVIPAHLITKEYFMLVAKHLEDDGVAIFNVIANARLADTYSKRVDNTIRAVFNRCMVSPGNYAGKRTNVLYTCNKPDFADAQDIYTDDVNQAATDIFKANS